ncbi:MAG: 6-phospho-3-hexuloisomerase [Burkholderiales bacterium]
MNNTIDICLAILKELEESLSKIDKQQAQTFADAIIASKKVFVAGCGRSLLMIRGLAMRLMHMGFEAYVVGETVTPAIGPGDLLIIASGSGETGTLVVMANKAKKAGASVALITIYPESTIGKLADHIVRINAATTKGTRESVKSIQPGANTFEQSVLLFGDATMVYIIERCNITESNTALMKRHANLE